MFLVALWPWYHLLPRIARFRLSFPPRPWPDFGSWASFWLDQHPMQEQTDVSVKVLQDGNSIHQQWHRSMLWMFLESSFLHGWEPCIYCRSILVDWIATMFCRVLSKIFTKLNRLPRDLIGSGHPKQGSAHPLVKQKKLWIWLVQSLL